MVVSAEPVPVLYQRFITNWCRIRPQVLRVDRAAFEEDLQWGETSLEQRFNQRNATVVLLKDGGGDVVGFTFAYPSGDCAFCDHPKEKYHRKVSVAPTACALSICPCKSYEELIYIACTAIHPDFQHQGLVGKLMDVLEAELKRRGFLYACRYASVENGYAAAIKRHYGPRILEISDPIDHGVMFFKYRL